MRNDRGQDTSINNDALINVSFNNQVNPVHLDRWWKNPASSMMRGTIVTTRNKVNKKKISYNKKSRLKSEKNI